MIFGHGLALIAVFMLFIDNDDAQIRKRRKKSGTGPYHDVQLSPLRAFRLVVFFPHGQGGIDNGDPVPESFIETKQRLIRQCNFRNQHNSLLSHRNHLFNNSQIDFRFTASGYPVNQTGSRSARPVILYNIFNNETLLLAQLFGLFTPLRPFDRIPIVMLLFYRDNTLFFQTVQGRGRHI